MLPRALNVLRVPTRDAAGRTYPREKHAKVRIAVLQHEAETGLGAFADALKDAGAEYEIVRTTGGLPLPDSAPSTVYSFLAAASGRTTTRCSQRDAGSKTQSFTKHRC